MERRYVLEKRPRWVESSENSWVLNYCGEDILSVAYLPQPFDQFEIALLEDRGLNIDGRYNDTEELTKRLHELGCGFVSLPKSLLEKKLVATE